MARRKGPGSTQVKIGPLADYMPKDKVNLPEWEREERYGRTKLPIPATRCYMSPITNFSRKDVRAEKWIIINEQAGTMTFANTFDGKLGSNWDRDTFTFRLDAAKLGAKVAEGMAEVKIEDCPIAVTLDQAKAGNISVPMSTTNTGVHAEQAHERAVEGHQPVPPAQAVGQH